VRFQKEVETCVHDLHRKLGVSGALLAGLAVAFGAFGAHALRERIGVDAQAIWRTAVDYQFWHALALLVIASTTLHTLRTARIAGMVLLAGCILFCGSLYALALGAPRALGMITPIGGVAFLGGWVMLIVAFLRQR
jgi:uncharacterized membrane protein YgdD (TMEM256/DUF423 family)